MAEEFEIRFRPHPFHSSDVTLEQAQEYLDAEGSWDGQDHLFAESIGCDFVRPKTELLSVDLKGINLDYRDPPDFNDEFELGVGYHCQYHSKPEEPCWGDLYQMGPNIVCAGHRGSHNRSYLTPDDLIRILRQGGGLGLSSRVVKIW